MRIQVVHGAVLSAPRQPLPYRELVVFRIVGDRADDESRLMIVRGREELFGYFARRRYRVAA